jgi:anti-sigma regulatory factor (Ser/Thr protein kinase)
VRQHPFGHQALLYRGDAEFVTAVVRFIGEGLARGEAVLVVVPPAQISVLESALDGDRHNDEEVSFVDVTDAGRNPATILPLWTDFVERNVAAGRGFRGVGEPVWPGRGHAALVECRNHEGLLNLRFEGGPGWELMCPYDAARLDDGTIEDALATHPGLLVDGEQRPNTAYDDGSGGWLGYDDPLPPPASPPRELLFGRASLHEVREFIAAFAEQEGAPPDRRADLILAVNEVVANSIRYGGGDGVLCVWMEGDTFVCEVSDRGTISDPFVGRRRPSAEQFGGRGLWIANRSCDLVQIRSRPGTTSVRLHMELDGHAA